MNKQFVYCNSICFDIFFISLALPTATSYSNTRCLVFLSTYSSVNRKQRFIVNTPMFVVFFSQWIADALCYSCIVANFSIIQFYWIEMSEIHGNEIKGKPAQTSIYRRTSFFCFCFSLFECEFVFCEHKISTSVCTDCGTLLRTNQ